MITVHQGKIGLLVAITGFGNIVGFNLVWSRLRRGDALGPGWLMTWAVVAILAGSGFAWLMRRVEQGQSPLDGEPPNRREAVEHALRCGRFDDDPDLHELERAVAVRRCRTTRQLWGFGLLVIGAGFGLPTVLLALEDERSSAMVGYSIVFGVIFVTGSLVGVFYQAITSARLNRLLVQSPHDIGT